MTKQFLYLTTFLSLLIFMIALNCAAQKHFVHTSTKANNSGNGDCSFLDISELNNNPEAIIVVTPVSDNGSDVYAHPVSVFYFKGKWNIMNLDQQAVPAGATFNVEYVSGPDRNHFTYLITKENLQPDGSAVLDYISLNNHPNAQFRYMLSWDPIKGPGIAHRDAVTVKYNSTTGKWYISNVNKRPLFEKIIYNIIIYNEENPLPGQRKEDPILSTRDLKTYKQPADTVPVISKISPKTKIIDPAAMNKKQIAASYDFSKVQLCIDKVFTKNLPPKKPFSFQSIPKIKSNGQLDPITTITQTLSGLTEFMWAPGEHITVGFDPKAPLLFINQVKQQVKKWEIVANVVFDFITNVNTASVKVGFTQDNSSWSWIGRNVLDNPDNYYTMNFGWFTATTPESEFSRTILHEFGHALGFIHEHQTSGAAGIAWDTAKVYSYFGGPPNNWSRPYIDQNIFQKYKQTETNSSTYDRLSIMHYFFSSDLTTDGSSFSENTTLSTVDKTFAKQVYPFPPTPPTATGILLTGDDCDEIEFKVEYNVGAGSEIEFILRPGYDHHNAIVNWWKMIGIPLKGSSGVEALQLNTSKKIQEKTIDRTKPITFGKAKVLGVHTGLGFTWAPWPALVGGSRVTFVWRRDSCN